MRVVFTPEADEQADSMDIWWRRNRPAARERRFFPTLLLLGFIGCTRTPAKTRAVPKTGFPNHFWVATVPGRAEFLVLNEFELKRDRLADRRHEQHRASIAAGTATSEPQTEEQKRVSLATEDSNYRQRLRYEFNRARIAYSIYENGSVDNDETVRMKGGFPMGCHCTLEADGSLFIESSFWVFGGMAIQVNLRKDGLVTGIYWEDKHKQAVFKAKLSDAKLVDNVQVLLEKRDVVLATAPRFAAGEALMGQLSFKSAEYYRSADYESGFSKEGPYSAQTMDTLRAAGVLNFTCQVVAR